MIVWTAMMAVREQDQFQSLKRGLGPFLIVWGALLLPIVLQDAYKLSASKTGLLLFPVAICDFIALNLAGRLYNRWGPRPRSRLLRDGLPLP